MPIFGGSANIRKLFAAMNITQVYAGADLVFGDDALYTPKDLFRSGEQGAWYDLTDLATLFQDAAGTIPVTAGGQPIGKILDKSGNNNHLTQANNAKRPTYGVNGVFNWMAFDGAHALKSAAFNMNSDAVTVFAGYNNAKTTGTGTMVEFSPNYMSTGGSFAALVPSLSTSRGSFGSNGGGGSGGEKEINQPPSGEKAPRVVTMFNKFSTADDYGCDYIRSNGLPVQGLIGAGNTNVGPGPYGTHSLFVGARNESQNYLGGYIAQLVVVGKECTEEELTNTEDFILAKIPTPDIQIVGELPALTVGVPITPFYFTATGGAPPYTFVEIGSPAQGVHVRSDGYCSGTPIISGAYNVTLNVADANNYPGSRQYTGVVAEAPVVVTIAGDFPAMTVGVPITPFSFTATGGTEPYTFTVFEGVMPAGVTLAGNGLVSGTPSEAGPYSVTIDATDSLGNNGYEVFTGDVAIDPSIWLPSALFANGENGGWWDLQDMGHDGEMVLGQQINPSPEFDSATGWFIGSAMAVTGGKLTANNTWASGQSSYANVVQRGKTYLVEFEVVDFVGTGTFYVMLGNSPSADGFVAVAGNGKYSTVLRAGELSGGYSRLAVENKSAAGYSMAMTYLHVTEVLDGFNPIMFQDANATVYVTASEQSLGLVLDKRKQSTWTDAVDNGWVKIQGDGAVTVSPDGKTITITDATEPTYVGRSSGNIPNVPGWARMQVAASYTNASGVSFWLRGAPAALTNGVSNLKGVALNNSSLERFDVASGTATFVIEEFRFFEGESLVMSTAAAKPLLTARVNRLGSNSENFENTTWNKVNCTITPNAVLAPNGTMTGRIMTDDATSGEHSVTASSNQVDITAIRRHSVYAKQDTGRYLAMNGYNVLSGSTWTHVFDLQTGTITDSGDPIYLGYGLMEDVGDGWWRCSVSTQYGSANLAYFTFGICNGPTDADANYVGAGSSIYVWGAQSEHVDALTDPPSRYQQLNNASCLDWKGFRMKARTDGVDDCLSANTSLVYYPAFTSVQSAAYSAWDATYPLPVFGSTTPGNGFMTARQSDLARFAYWVNTPENMDIASPITKYTPEVLTHGYDSPNRVYRVDNAPLTLTADTFNAGFNATYPFRVAQSPFNTTYKGYAALEWGGGVYISRGLTQQEHDNTYNYLAGNPVSTAPSFDPASLFTGGVLGYCYDPLDLSTMSQDDAGTVPVTGVGQELGMLRDISGNNAHRTQVTQSKRPLASVNGYTFDGTDDGLQSIVDTSLGGEWTHILRTNPGADTPYLLMCSTSTNGFFGVGEQSAGTTASQGCAVSSIEVDGAIITNQRSSIYAALVNGDHTIIHKITSIDNTAFKSTFRVGDYTGYQYSGYYGREILINKALIGQELTDALAWVGGA